MNEPVQSPDYRQTLKEAFVSRREKNAAYSLRSFARDLSVSPSMLSDVLNYKKKLTRKSAAKMKPALKLSKREAELFLLSVDLEQPFSGRSKQKTLNAILERNAVGRVLSLDEEKTAYISDPRHFAMIALFGVKGFRFNLTWMASALGLFQFQASKIFRRLQNLGVIKTNAKNEAELQQDFVAFPDGVPSPALRTYNRTTLNMALQAIDTVPVEERDFHNYIFAIDESDLDAIRVEVRTFHRQLYLKYAQKPTANRVYSIQNQCIPLSSRINS